MINILSSITPARAPPPFFISFGTGHETTRKNENENQISNKEFQNDLCTPSNSPQARPGRPLLN